MLSTALRCLRYRYAVVAFPNANFYLIADPDTFIQLSHLSDE